MRNRFVALGALAAVCASALFGSNHATAATWSEDATRDYYDYASRLHWATAMGTWRDANLTAQGAAAFASAAVADLDREQVIDIDVTSIVQRYGADFFLRRSGGAAASFHSKESAVIAKRPQLILTRASGTSTLVSAADASLDASTMKGLGGSATLSTKGNILLRFAQGADAGVTRAVMRLTTVGSQYGAQTIGVHLADPTPDNSPYGAPPPGPAPAPPPAPPPAPGELPLVARTWTEDATRDFYNAALHMKWSATGGAWRDAAGLGQGAVPFATQAFVDTNTEKPVEWDVTALVKAHGADFLIRRIGGTSVKFHAREAATPAVRPVLVVTRAGTTTTLQASADAWLDSSTAFSNGEQPLLQSAGAMLVKFDQAADPALTRAVLRMTASAEQYGNQTLSVFRTDSAPAMPQPLALPLGGAPDIVLRLSGNAWRTTSMGAFRTDRNSIAPSGALSAFIPVGSDLGSDMGYAIPRAARRETMFARLVMKVHADFDATMGGKHPGLSNTGMGDRRAVQCGWGSRVADGVCWSARTGRWGDVPGNPSSATHQAIYPYVYRLNRTTSYGESSGEVLRVPFTKGRFAALDQMVKLNSVTNGVAASDGEVAYWLDGVLVSRMTGIKFRSRLGDDTLPSEYWLDVYEGGTGYKAPKKHSVTVHEAIVSTRLLPFDAAALAVLNGS